MTSFEIVTEWSFAKTGSLQEQDTAAELTLKVGDNILTRAFDSWSRTVTDRTRVAAYPLAEWLASCWWRLRYEAVPVANGRPSPAWRMAHDLPAVGAGFVWPRVRIASDGEAMQIAARAVRNAAWEPTRYLTDLAPTRVPHDTFDRAIDDFIRLVLERLHDTRTEAQTLQSLWGDVLAERADPDVSAWRQLEARLGYYADEAPEDLIRRVGSMSDRAGEAATNEIASIIGSEAAEEQLARLVEIVGHLGLPARFNRSNFPIGPEPFDLRRTPWERGRALARDVRQSSKMSPGPVSDKALCDILAIPTTALTDSSSGNSLVGLGVRTGDSGRLSLHFRQRHKKGLRFQAARFIADQLIAPQNDTWLPLTDSVTARQQLQRAFAAEFLVPIESLVDFLDGTLSSDAFDEAAEHFGVSPLAISSHLANNDVIPTEAVAP
ncbi:MAG: hypothetical protein J0H01_28915 [Rhizobiales bacterium]|nr:hypothetical protein [Hyphomicrobiales bacterium]